MTSGVHFFVIEKLSLSSYQKRILRFYQQVKVYQKMFLEPQASLHERIPHLTATLLGYQESALRWMLAREECGEEETEKLHILWRELEGAENLKVYYSPYMGK